MYVTEPIQTALLLATIGILLGASVLFSRVTDRAGIPVTLLFLAIGMLAGSEGIGGIDFEDYRLTYRLGTAALVLILFDGGLNTPLAATRTVIGPAAVLATFGVVGTALLVAVGAYLLGFAWPESMLLGAVVSSTDAAAVFSVLRGSGLHLKRRLGATLELESGVNDPLAVILTVALTHNILQPQGLGWMIVVEILTQLTVGGALGLALGFGERFLLGRIRLAAGGLYPVLTMALALLAFSLPSLFFGSGFLSVYLAGMIVGNGPLPYRRGLLRVHDSLAWLSQTVMFLLLGLLIFPSQLLGVAGVGLVLGLILVFVARPAVVLLCLAPFRYPLREIGYAGWVGLRGAVPIILATYPVLAGIEGAHRLFNVVFFLVVVNAMVTGLSVRWLTRRLKLESGEPPPPPVTLEIVSTRVLEGEVLLFHIEPGSIVCGTAVHQLSLPPETLVMLILRGQELLAPRGETVFEPGDHVYVYSRYEDQPLVRLVFGRQE